MIGWLLGVAGAYALGAGMAWWACCGEARKYRERWRDALGVADELARWNQDLVSRVEDRVDQMDRSEAHEIRRRQREIDRKTGKGRTKEQILRSLMAQEYNRRLR